MSASEGSSSAPSSLVNERLTELKIQTSSYGNPIPVCYGMVRVPGNVIYYNDFTAYPKVDTSRSGKGGGTGPAGQNPTYTYSAAVMLALCEGPVRVESKAWLDKECYSAVSLGLTIANGTVAQTPWTYLLSAHPDHAVGYGSTAYAASTRMDLGDNGTLKNFSFEIRGLFSSLATAYDANPADILSDALSNPVHGAGWPVSSLASLADYRSYCSAAGLFLSPCYSAQKPMLDHISELLATTNSGPVWSGGKLKIIPFGDVNLPGWYPDNTPQYDLTLDDFLVSGPSEDPVKLIRKSPTDAYNAVQVKYENRANDYAAEVAEASDLGAQELYGPRPATPYDAIGVKSSDVARRVAQILLQKHLYLRNEYEFKLGWRYSRLEPMDLVNISDSVLGLVRTTVRIEAVEEDENAEITVRAIEWPFGVAGATQYTNPGGLDIPYDWAAAPGDAYPPVIFEPPFELTGGEHQIWAGTGGGPNWGGCEIWISRDGSSYSQQGEVINPARKGEMRTYGLTAMTVRLDSGGSLASFSDADAAVFQGRFVVGKTVKSYQWANLAKLQHYNLSGVTEELYGTPPFAGAPGTPWMLLDNAVSRIAFEEQDIGRLLYIKLVSYNKWGLGRQDISTLTPYLYTLSGPSVQYLAPSQIATFCGVISEQTPEDDPRHDLFPFYYAGYLEGTWAFDYSPSSNVQNLEYYVFDASSSMDPDTAPPFFPGGQPIDATKDDKGILYDPLESNYIPFYALAVRAVYPFGKSAWGVSARTPAPTFNHWELLTP